MSEQLLLTFAWSLHIGQQLLSYAWLVRPASASIALVFPPVLPRTHSATEPINQQKKLINKKLTKFNSAVQFTAVVKVHLHRRFLIQFLSHFPVQFFSWSSGNFQIDFSWFTRGISKLQIDCEKNCIVTKITSASQIYYTSE